MMTPALAAVLAVCCAAAVTDLRRRRIPNALTIPLAATGVALGAAGGWHAFLASLAFLGAILAAGTVLHARGAMGGGDVKLAAAAAATLNYPDGVTFLLYTCVAGGALALLVSTLRGRLMRAVRSTVATGVSLALGLATPAPAEDVALPYAVAMATAAVLVALSHSLLPSLRLLP